MATPSKKGKYLYKADDLVDDFLFDEVAKDLKIDQIGAFVRTFREEETIEPLTWEEQTRKVSYPPGNRDRKN